MAFNDHMPGAAYDEIAEWYETEFLDRQATGNDPSTADPLGIDRALRDLLGPGADTCLDLGCGTGAQADRIRELGWTPVGVDLSAGMLRYARGRLPVVQADAERLPVRDGAVPAAVAVMVHTDMPGYPAVLREVGRLLRPGGLMVHIGVHPCFCGGFADRSDTESIIIRSGYLETYWTKDSFTTEGVRDKVGAMHRPLPALLNAFLDAGLTLERFAEGAEPTPIMLAIRARKAR